MQREGISPNAITYNCILKACRAMHSLIWAIKSLLVSWLLEKDVVLGTALVNMYVKCGVVHKAKKGSNVVYFIKLRKPRCFGLFSAYQNRGPGSSRLFSVDVKHGHLSKQGHRLRKARILLQMQASTFCIFKVCATKQDAEMKRRDLSDGMTYIHSLKVCGMTQDGDIVGHGCGEKR